ncbi:MAG: hypothetical protein U0996_06935 [Planctomycetaceae bacterium]
MPIQFRCEYCRQLLGISQSRAGSMVDCPACGRSLLVPSKDGAPAKPVRSAKAQADARLLNALAELSGLGGTATEPEAPPTTSVPQPRSPKLAQTPAITARPSGSPADQMRIVPLKPGTQDAFEELADIQNDGQSDEVPDVEEPELLDEPESGQQERAHQTAPVDPFREALQELTTLPPLAAAPPVHASSGSMNRPFVWGIVFATAGVAFGLGCLVGKSLTGSDDRKAAEALSASRDPSHAAVAEPASPPEKKDDATAATPAVAGQLTGTVKYKNAAGEIVADSDALLLLVPSKNATTLRLDGRPLREDPQSPARLSIEAALSILEVSVSRVGADGTFVLPQKHRQSQRLVVISRHKSRPDGESVPGDAQQTLSEWFESTAHLVGRLSAKVVLVDAPGSVPTPTVDVTFE